MPATRHSQTSPGDSSPATAKTNGAGTKRKASEATSPESVKPKQQKTLEQTIENGNAENGDSDMQKAIDASKKDQNGDRDMQETIEASKQEQNGGEAEKENKKPEQNGSEAEKEDTKQGADKAAFDSDLKDAENGADAEKEVEPSAGEKSALESVKADEKEDGKTTKPEPEESGVATNGDSKGTAVEEDKSREEAQPSNVLEKGIIYFFTRGRVGMDDPSNVTELQRSHFVLRPLPSGAKLTDGSIQDAGNNRLIALPKKVWPKSGKDRFMAFVEKGKSTMEALKETFFSGSDYSTKTVGTRHTPEVTPVGEGVYAITSTGDGTAAHLAYMLTIPQELGEVQKDIGLAEKGSFILSSKNPESSSPSYAQLPSKAEFPKEILEKFGARSWMPTVPEHLDYENASFLLIGENADSGLEATAQDEKDNDKEVPEEELIKLEEEDEERIKNLKGDKSVFEDLGISSKEYSLKSTW